MITGTHENRREFGERLFVVQSNLLSKSGSNMQIRETFDLSPLGVVLLVHKTSLKFKLQNYRSYRDFTFTVH